MDISAITSLFTTLGFPVACVIGLGFFIWVMWKNTREDNAKAMSQLQERCLAREERMSKQLDKNESILQKSIETLAFYEAHITRIEDDVQDIVATVKKE